MVSDAPENEQVRAIALFFLFALMDEKVALEAAHKTIAQIKAGQGRNFSGGTAKGELAAGELVLLLRKAYDHYRKQVPRNRPTALPTTAWQLESLVDLAPWQRFQKEATEPEMVAVILSKILGLDDQAIADGLGISIGTARYRISKGIRNLGQIALQPSAAKKA
jgi:hypothetical protein